MKQVPANEYLRTRVMTASAEELRLMLLDGAIKFAKQGRQGIEDTDPEAIFNGFNQSRAIVMELVKTMRPELAPELCDKVKSLYLYIFGLLLSASHDRDLAKADEAIELIQYERETWAMLMDSLRTEAPAQAPKAPQAQAPNRHAGGSISIQG